MSAAEKLERLVAHSSGVSSVRFSVYLDYGVETDVSAEIIAVVKAAEKALEELDAHGLSTHMKDGECKAGYVLSRGRDTLTALAEKLNVSQ